MSKHSSNISAKHRQTYLKRERKKNYGKIALKVVSFVDNNTRPLFFTILARWREREKEQEKKPTLGSCIVLLLPTSIHRKTKKNQNIQHMKWKQARRDSRYWHEFRQQIQSVFFYSIFFYYKDTGKNTQTVRLFCFFVCLFTFLWNRWWTSRCLIWRQPWRSKFSCIWI